MCFFGKLKSVAIKIHSFVAIVRDFKLDNIKSEFPRRRGDIPQLIAYVAVFGGLLVAFVICRRFALLGFGAIQFLMIALTANGIDRIKTISDLAEGSIRNRFLAWRGGM